MLGPDPEMDRFIYIYPLVVRGGGNIYACQEKDWEYSNKLSRIHQEHLEENVCRMNTLPFGE